MPRFIQKTVFKNFDSQIFFDMLSKSKFEEVLECFDLDMAYYFLVSKISSVLDTLAPIKRIQMRHNYVPSLSENSKKLQIERNLAQERAATSPRVLGNCDELKSLLELIATKQHSQLFTSVFI